MRLHGFSKSQKSLLSSSLRCSARSILCPVLFSLFINNLPASLPSFVSCPLYANNLAIRSSFPALPAAVKATQRTLIQLERWSEYWCLPFNSSKCETSFFSVDPYQANLQPDLLLFNSPQFLSHPNFSLYHFRPHFFLF